MPSETKRFNILMAGSETDAARVVKESRLKVNFKDTQGAALPLSQDYPPRVIKQDLLLPTLYLHFLDTSFHVTEEERCLSLRGGNDNSEIILALPDAAVAEALRTVPEDSRDAFKQTIEFVRNNGTYMVGPLRECRGGWTPQRQHKCLIDVNRMSFSFKTARPKSEISINKAAFGIPEEAEIYLFAENHSSILHATPDQMEAFSITISCLCDEYAEKAAQNLGIFLKIFMEGGFAYNKRISTGSRSYLPQMVGIAAMSTVPAFDVQRGLSTGYPFKVEPGFHEFTDTVPVTIPAIREMSALHKRYGLCFTQVVHFTKTESDLKFSCITPHGGFFYVPESVEEYAKHGALVYAFGESTESKVCLETSVVATSTHDNEHTDIAPQPSRGRSEESRRICTLCLDAEASAAVVPCGHLAFCTSCADSAMPASLRCPVCRGAIDRIQRVYI